MQTNGRQIPNGHGRYNDSRIPQGNGPTRDDRGAPRREARGPDAGRARRENDAGGREYRRADRERDNTGAPSRFDRRAAEREPASVPLVRPELRPVHDARCQHITATVWERPGYTRWEAYTVTLTRTFYSERNGQYLTTTKLFAEDVPLALGALSDAYAWIERQIGEPLPF